MRELLGMRIRIKKSINLGIVFSSLLGIQFCPVLALDINEKTNASFTLNNWTTVTNLFVGQTTDLTIKKAYFDGMPIEYDVSFMSDPGCLEFDGMKVTALKTGVYQVPYFAEWSEKTWAEFHRRWPDREEPSFTTEQPYITFVVGENPFVFRLYNPNSGEHFYTTDIVEQNYLSGIGWQDESVGWQSGGEADEEVYRLYNPNTGDHHYTLDPVEYERLEALGWRQEGAAFTAPAQGREVYRLYNPNETTGTHHYTQSLSERVYLMSLGWQDEGVCWHTPKEN